jgi:hypothetical protein
MNNAFYSRLFSLGAVWNICIGLTGVLFYEFSITLFFGSDAVAYNLISVMFYKLLMGVIIIFGVGYFIVSRDLTLNRGIVWLGLVSKMILFFIFTYLFFEGKATILAFFTLIGDFIWSMFFIMFLWQTKDLVRINNIVG